jgi:hypothetical protein
MKQATHFSGIASSSSNSLGLDSTSLFIEQFMAQADELNWHDNKPEGIEIWKGMCSKMCFMGTK